MGNTYTQLHIQFVFAVKFREALIDGSWEQRLYQYITGIVQNHDHKLIAVNGMPDHLHVFVGLHPVQSISDLMKTVKGESSEWINKEGFTAKSFDGRMDMVLSVTVIVMCRMFINTFSTKKNIIVKKHFWKNTKSFWRSLMWILMNDIFLKSLNNWWQELRGYATL
jgi:REP element-mobilizing transposase RayT